MSVSHPDIPASACANVAKGAACVPSLLSSPPFAAVAMYHVAPDVVEAFTVMVCVEVTEPAASVAFSV